MGRPAVVDPKKLEDTVERMSSVINEVSERFINGEIDILEARVAQDAVRSKVEEVLAKRELSTDEWKILSSITSSPSSDGLTIMGTEFTREAVQDIFEQVEKVRRDRHKVELHPSLWKPLIPIEPLKPLRDEIGLSSRAYSSMRTRTVGILAGVEEPWYEKSTPDVAPMALANTAAVVPNSDPYRVAGKRTIEDLLDEAGIDYKIIIHVTLDSYRGAEHLEPEQRALLAEIDRVHPNISCLYELPGTALAVSETRQPNIFRRFWDEFVLRFGNAMAGMK